MSAPGEHTVSNMATFGTSDRDKAMRWRRNQAKRLGVTTKTITTALRSYGWSIYEIERLKPEDASDLEVHVGLARPGRADNYDASDWGHGLFETEGGYFA